ncbi:ATP-binding protein [Terriglobus tenax]|uniref:ATP-binding protein n=1 Tax=Terriglobus tenax TaxID=1111115 RepID=UPI0021DFC36E|nr:ATP-binding protein [Terriglobus tenax]
MSLPLSSSEIDEKLQLLLEAGQRLSTVNEVEALLQTAVDAGCALSGAQTGLLFYSPPSGGAPLCVTSGTAPAVEALPAFQIPQQVLRLDGGAFLSEPSWIPPQLLSKNFRSYLAVPFRSSPEAGAGVFFYGSEQNEAFSDQMETCLVSLAAQTASALEMARLRRQLQGRESEENAHARHLSELAAIVASSEDPILSKSLDGVITSWNAAASRVLGYTAEEIVGQSILQLIPPELHTDEAIIQSKIRNGERLEHFETVRLTKNGDRIDVSLSVSPLKDETGRIVGASKILRDITARKRMEQSLLQAEKIAATGRMAATIAHEINNPLESVINLLYLLRPMIVDPDGIGYLDTAELELARVSHIAKQTLGFYREHASAKPVSVAELMQHALRVYEPRCQAFWIKVEQHITSERKPVLRQGEMLQVISNLITNSIYAMPNGGTLRVSVKDTPEPGDGVIFSIEDTGTGIAPENLERIFEAFFTTRSTIGTGIGLFISRQFVEGHGGRISVTSSTDKDAHGTCFEVFLPLSPPSEA